MKEQLKKIESEILEKIPKTKSIQELEDIRVGVLGKKGELKNILKAMGGLSNEERPVIGKMANEIRENIQNALEDAKKKINEEEQLKKLKEEKIDVTIPGNYTASGHRHPLMQVKEQLENLFLSMGFDVIDGPEIDTVENNFDALNAPVDHPSRDKSDTFYFSDDLILRTQTSPVQIRTMKTQKPPIRMVSAGRTFRFDDVDDTHSPMFHQMECLVVDKGVTLANLKDSIDKFVKALFGEDMKTRFRPHNFPFTEPSAEVDVSCLKCMGEGCEACHHTGWSMELLGCGMVHPNVLRNCGIDPEVYSGYAFGMGIDRITMVKHGIHDIRLLFDNDLRFLKQF
ncbi:phenylalanyl-tRNA synthetase, alpha subunit [Dethiosulfatibacter aminovorans DSM 17477]|uniref:Phenylalanine--tRNA ligase alpha subunit n=1 Tax=Dethiosulfatibacter aminovorans DSM 17477 TaxID=1121476 RepID=A0A1M6DM65_9FIRM|nr:phenylalanine--tRNA ligase subunit alpha [Dethiosulfatibacter aminovorans]SHI74292.1 phenylalanyl-tRNA synthetase, alpha subunit [Dethiosulfatibacter aminovorans DSM 17477]